MGATGSFGDTLARLEALGGWFAFDPAPDGDRWSSATDIVSGGPGFEAALSRFVIGSGEPDQPRANGSRFLLGYLRVIWPAIAAFALDRRVPDVSAGNILVRLGDEGPTGVALARNRFATLRGDPAEAEASYVADSETDLAAWLWEVAVESHALLLVPVLNRATRTSVKVLNGNIASAFAVSLLFELQTILPAPTQAADDLRHLLPGSSQFAGAVALIEVPIRGRRFTVHQRRTCCLEWQFSAGAKCDECPLIRDTSPLEAMFRGYVENLLNSDPRAPIPSVADDSRCTT